MFTRYTGIKISIALVLVMLHVVISTFPFTKANTYDAIPLDKHPIPDKILEAITYVNKVEAHGMRDNAVYALLKKAYYNCIVGGNAGTFLEELKKRAGELCSNKEILKYVSSVAYIALVLALIVLHKYIVPLIWYAVYRKSIVTYSREKRVRRDIDPVEALYAILIVSLIMVAAFNIAQQFNPLGLRRALEIGLVDEEGHLTYYLRRTVIGSNETIYLYIGNIGNYTEAIMVRVGIDNSTAEGIGDNAYSIERYYTILVPGEKHVYNLQVVFTVKGLQRIVIELWRYDHDSKTYVYTRQWVYIWVEVTGLLE